MAIGVRGTLKLRDDNSKLVLIAEPTDSTANCSADQVLESLTLLVRDPRTRATEPMNIDVRSNKEIAGLYDVKFAFRDQTWHAEMLVRSVGRPHADAAAPRGR